MTENHPITPPKNLLSHWQEVINYGYSPERIEEMLTEAARWGANEELEACVEWLAFPEDKEKLRADRRPKPPSLKELALEALRRMDQLPTAEDQSIILRALEALPD